VFVTIPNVLANRYASAEMVAIWSPEAKIVAERRLWLSRRKVAGSSFPAGTRRPGTH